MNASLPTSDAGSITRVAGIEVGHFTDARRPTGCTVVMAREGAVGGVDVRGAAPGTRETDLLDPCNLVEKVHAIVLAGGSAWGLEAATGAVRWLEERGVVWDLNYRGDLLFLDQARRQAAARQLQIEDGWTYFIYGWTRVIAEVFHVDIPTAGEAFDEICRIAEQAGKPALQHQKYGTQGISFPTMA